MSRPPAHDPLDVLALHARGLTAQQAADHLGIAPCTLRQTARDIGLPPFRDPRQVPDDVAERVRELRAAGATLRAIAAETGLSYTGVRKVLGRDT